MLIDVKENLFFFLIICFDIIRINVYYIQRNFVIFVKFDFWVDFLFNFMLVFYKLCLEFLFFFYLFVNDKIVIFLCFISFYFFIKNII